MKPILELWPYLKRYRLHMLIVILSTLGVTAVNLVNPWLVRSLVQIISDSNSDKVTILDAIARLTLGLIAIFLLRAVFRFLTSYIAHVMAWNFVNDLRVALYGHLQHLSPRFYADRQTGELLTRVIKDTQDIEPLIAHYIPDLIVNILLILGVAVILFSLNPFLALLTLIPMPLLAIDGVFFGNRMRSWFKLASRRLGALSAVVQDNLAGIKEIQIFTQEQREHGRVNTLSKLTTDDRLIALKLQAILQPTIELLASSGVVIIVWFGGHAVLNSGLKIEDLVAFILYLNIFYQPIVALSQMSEMLHTALAGADRVSEVLNLIPDVVDGPKSLDPGRVQGEIVFNNVSFDYRPGAPTLRNVSLTVKPGQTLALVGPTGAGKTTIASLIPRFYDPQQGSITIDGIDVRDIQLNVLRSNISMVLQDVFLFAGTVRDNIRYSNTNATDDEIIRAAKAAHAHEFIEAMSDGYDTQIGERGVRLSGGQKQRLAIARAILKNAPILIMDEATSAVDTETEAEIQEALTELMKNRTAIVIAHRLSTIRNADLIAVMNEGQIVQMGKHDELVEGNGLYARLHHASVAV
jgi:ATP-binding cassette, subfamily B, bacterial